MASAGLAITCLLQGLPVSTAQSTKASVPAVEAAYLFNFGKFIRWPQNVRTTDDAFAICVLGDDPFGPVLEQTVSGETINGKKVAAKHISRALEAAACSIVYISPSEEGRLSRILQTLRDLPVLTVSDLPDFLDRGGIIQFVVHGGRVRFQVNLEPTERDGLNLSSELLKVALNVKGNLGKESH